MQRIIVAVVCSFILGMAGCMTGDICTNPPVVSPTIVPNTSSVTNSPTIPSKIPWWIDESMEGIQ